MTKYTALDIAKYVINKCNNDDKSISNLQLQKILYFLQLEHLKKNGVVLFNDDIEAWHYGPVVADVYYEYSKYGADKIEKNQEVEVEVEEKTTTIINPIVEEKREKKPWLLVEETHKKGGSWDKVYNERGNGHVIEIELMRELDI